MLNRKHKFKLAASLFFATAASICLFAAIGKDNKTIKNVNSTAYSLTLNSSNGSITDASYSDTIKQTAASKTALDNAFSMSYYHAKGQNGSYCVLDAHNPFTNSSGKDGYLYTTNGVNGLNEITINYEYENDNTAAGDLLVYFSDSSTFNGDPIIAESGKNIIASGSYFKVQALSQSIVINSIAISYSCDENSHVYPSEASTSHTSKATTSLTVTDPTNDLVNDFVFGVDMSMVAETESLGGVYKNENNVAEDPFQILADDGANYARIRLWVDPYTASSRVSYEGGTNDIETDVHLAKRAKAAGMKVLLDLHYSDFWADPTHQWKPKSWGSATANQITTYTTSVMNRFKNEGITLDSVQIGNEINRKLAGVSYESSTYFAMLNAGVTAVKSVFPNAKTILHLANVHQSSIYGYIDGLCSNVSNFDILGLSYYPFWHGGISNLTSALNYVANKGKDVMVMETSWGYTLDGDPNWYAQQTFYPSDEVDTSLYSVSNQGQVDEICAVVDALSKVPNNRGKGIFYWGPDYLAVQGAHWASKAGQYYNDHGSDGTGDYTDASCRIAWANQSLFDYDGKVMGSAQTYKLLKDDVSPVTPTTYTQDTTDLKYAVATYVDGNISDWGTDVVMSYDNTTDNWSATIQINSLDKGIVIYSSHKSVWTGGKVDHWYLRLANPSLFDSNSPYLFLETGTYNLIIKDSIVDGDLSTCFGYYMSVWSEEGIVNCLTITKA